MSDTTISSTPTVTPPGMTAKQTDGSVKTYAGTDTVANGVIVAAHITQTGGPAA